MKITVDLILLTGLVGIFVVKLPWQTHVAIIAGGLIWGIFYMIYQHRIK